MSRSCGVRVLARRIGKLVLQEPAMGAGEAVIGRNLRLPPDRQNAARMHRLARRAAGLGRVDHDPAGESRRPRDPMPPSRKWKFRSEAATGVLIFVVIVEAEKAAAREIIHTWEIPANARRRPTPRPPRAPRPSPRGIRESAPAANGRPRIENRRWARKDCAGVTKMQ